MHKVSSEEVPIGRNLSLPRGHIVRPPGLAAIVQRTEAFDASRRSHVDHALETAVHIELLRRHWEPGYVRTQAGYEVDFLAGFHGRDEELIQVCASPEAPGTLGRELRALADAASRYPDAIGCMLVLTREQAVSVTQTRVRVQPAYEWMLETAGTQ